MSFAPARLPRGGHGAALLGAGLAAAAVFAAVQAGLVPAPDLEAILTDLSDSLGAWTYALVGALDFLATGAFVGLVAPCETAVVLGGVVAAEGGVDLVPMLAITWAAASAGVLAAGGSPSAPQRATVRRSPPSAARPTGAGSQIASAR